MRNEFEGIIKALEIESVSAENLRIQTLTLCIDQENAKALIKELEIEKEESNCRSPDHYYALCALFKSCAYDMLKDSDSAIKETLKAIDQFRRCGNDLNEALSHWFLGILYNAYREEHLAFSELDEAKKLLVQCAQDYDVKSNFKRKFVCDRYIKKITSILKSIKGKANLHPTRKPVPAPPATWKAARLTSGVYDIGHASQSGKFVFDDSMISKLEIEFLKFDNLQYKIYSLRGGMEVKLKPSGEYHWLKVAGTSMNHATPIPIEPGNYILADLSLTPRIGDIIIARFKNPPTTEERAGVIKRYAPTGLVSESRSAVPVIPLSDIELRGVVIAVAKPG
jgi:hypothetical protein